MSTDVSNKTLRELAICAKELITKHGVSYTLQSWEKAVEVQSDISSDEKERYLHFLLNATAIVVQNIPHFAGVEISASAGIEPGTDIPFILASSEEQDHYAMWFARPVEHHGRMVTEVTCGWYEDGRDALC
ncbi:hypothetical protein QP794_02710 [Paenibacillus sp. UMB7766-LJ446]|uniref:hypothetical protein n=1 Tax=Paenibacillus sp. UMB7766-LJ446 TaxID=3046313 RepID=UPI00254C7020|nr:hypothetical protein [Paenibacillus sp. UMB7766-LJ446]MDK8188997.1 hypothetical protein [Paenibacillus sp. UMB7766-LJ446]